MPQRAKDILGAFGFSATPQDPVTLDNRVQEIVSNIQQRRNSIEIPGFPERVEELQREPSNIERSLSMFSDALRAAPEVRPVPVSAPFGLSSDQVQRFHENIDRTRQLGLAERQQRADERRTREQGKRQDRQLDLAERRVGLDERRTDLSEHELRVRQAMQEREPDALELARLDAAMGDRKAAMMAENAARGSALNSELQRMSALELEALRHRNNMASQRLQASLRSAAGMPGSMVEGLDVSDFEDKILSHLNLTNTYTELDGSRVTIDKDTRDKLRRHFSEGLEPGETLNARDQAVLNTVKFNVAASELSAFMGTPGVTSMDIIKGANVFDTLLGVGHNGTLALMWSGLPGPIEEAIKTALPDFGPDNTEVMREIAEREKQETEREQNIANQAPALDREQSGQGFSSRLGETIEQQLQHQPQRQSFFPTRGGIIPRN